MWGRERRGKEKNKNGFYLEGNAVDKISAGVNSEEETRRTKT